MYKPTGKSNGNPVSTSFVGNEFTFEKIGQKAMLFFDIGDFDSIEKIINRALDDMEISNSQAKQLRQIFEVL